MAAAPLWVRRQWVRQCADAADMPSACSSGWATGRADCSAEPQGRCGCDSKAMAAQRGHGGTNGGSARQGSRARGQWLAVASLGQAQAGLANPAWRHGVTSRDAAMCAARGGRAHGANHPEIVTCTNFKAPVKTKRMILEPSHLHHAQESILGYP